MIFDFYNTLFEIEMADKALPLIKRNSNDKKHRIFEVIQSIKDAILKVTFL